MRIVTAGSAAGDTRAAWEEMVAGLDRQAPGMVPDFVSLHFSCGLDAGALARAACGLWPGAAIHGGTSCQGVMTDQGPLIAGETGAGLLAIYDPMGSFGTGHAPILGDAQAAGRIATERALQASGRAGEVPDFVWLTLTPGSEEAVLRGVRQVVGDGTPILGGSAADNDVSGGWAQIAGGQALTESVVVSVLFPSRPLACDFQSGYAPAGPRGRVTAAAGRRLIAIDDQPAAHVYAGWAGGIPLPAPHDPPLSILDLSTFRPLGRISDDVGGVPFHLLAHPARVHGDGTIELFADVAVGDELWLMEGSETSLVARAGRVAQAARNAAADQGADDIAGALVIYCGGCMLGVKHRMEDVVAGLSNALDGRPFLGVFTFGEQGSVTGGPARHGNLMISCAVFAG